MTIPLVIVGPTSSGKTNLSLFLAEKILQIVTTEGVDILVIDSKQVYRGQDVVTGKDIPEGYRVQGSEVRGKLTSHFFNEEKNIRIFGLDLVDPDEQWSVAQFVSYAKEVVAKSQTENRFLILVVGTPQFFYSLVDVPRSFPIPPNEALREKLETWSVTQLQEELAKVDEKRLEGMNESDLANPRRLIRAIEVAQSPLYETMKAEPVIKQWDGIGLEVPIDALPMRIEKRVRSRIEQGAEDEYVKLVNKYPNWSKEAKAALGYDELAHFISGDLTAEELVSFWTLHEVQYARRQMQWWKKEEKIHWFVAVDDELQDHVVKYLKACYTI